MLSSLTVRAWPRRVDPAGPIPHPFHRSYLALDLVGPEVPTIVYGPRLRFGKYESTSKLLVWSGRRVACLDARRGGVVTTLLNLDELYLVEWGQALLEGWLRLAAHGHAGHASARTEFNTVGRDLYLPLLAAARLRAYAAEPRSHANPTDDLSPLLAVDYRFVGFGRQALLPGAELRRHFFQPRVTGPFLRVFDQTRVRATLLLATQAELIAIQEGEGHGTGRYGVTFTYLPLRRIRGGGAVPRRAAPGAGAAGDPARRGGAALRPRPGERGRRAGVPAGGRPALRRARRAALGASSARGPGSEPAPTDGLN